MMASFLNAAPSMENLLADEKKKIETVFQNAQQTLTKKVHESYQEQAKSFEDMLSSSVEKSKQQINGIVHETANKTMSMFENVKKTVLSYWG